MNIFTFHIRLLPLAVVAVLAVVAPPVQAAILEDFLFGESNGTTLDNAENSVNSGNTWVLGGASWDPSAVNNGSFRISKTSTALATAHIDIANIDNTTMGKAWLVAEIAGWNYVTTASALDAVVRFAFLDNDNMPPSGSTITAQMQINRDSAGNLQLAATALGTGSTNIGNVSGLPLVQTDPFTMVLELDKDLNRYSLFYREGDASFQAGGTGDLGQKIGDTAIREGNSIRFGATGDFSDPGEFFDIDRIYLTDVSPLTAVDKLKLQVNTTTGAVSILNDTSSTFDIDWYRITSSDDSLEYDNWNSLSDQEYDAIDGPDPGGIAGDGVGETWDEAGGSNDSVLSESFLLGSSVFDPDESVGLGNVFKHLTGTLGSLEFEYRDAVTTSVIVGEIVEVVGLAGDHNGDGAVDAADYALWRSDPDAYGGAQGYTDWVSNFGQSSGSGSSLSHSSVPEPASVWLVLLAATVGCGRRRRIPSRVPAMR